jgi:Fe-S-cluster containining protein
MGEKMKNNHLRLVAASYDKKKEKRVSVSYSEKIKDFFDCIFISENKKIYLIKDTLTRLYKDYEETTGIIDVPYFVKADRRISQIIKSGKINYYYKKLKKNRFLMI